jgi:hypothetical protein
VFAQWRYFPSQENHEKKSYIFPGSFTKAVIVDAIATTVLGNMKMNAMSRIKYTVDLVIPVFWFKFNTPELFSVFLIFPFSSCVVVDRVYSTTEYYEKGK